jgi:hypothetical protein
MIGLSINIRNDLEFRVEILINDNIRRGFNIISTTKNNEVHEQAKE